MLFNKSLNQKFFDKVYLDKTSCYENIKDLLMYRQFVYQGVLVKLANEGEKMADEEVEFASNSEREDLFFQPRLLFY